MLKRLRPAILGVAAFLAANAGAAAACEWVEDSRTPAERRQDFVESFGESEIVYRGVVLQRPDIGHGGRFLVLQAYKGPAKAFEVIPTPSASSCHEGFGIVPYGYWAGLSESFNAFAERDRIDVWAAEGFVDRLPWKPEGLILAAVATVGLLAIRLLGGRRRRPRPGRRKRH